MRIWSIVFTVTLLILTLFTHPAILVSSAQAQGSDTVARIGEPASSVDAVLTRMVQQARLDDESLAEIRSLRIDLQITDSLGYLEAPSTTTATLYTDSRGRFNLVFPDRRSGFNGDHGWTIRDGVDKSISKKQATNPYWIFNPWVMADMTRWFDGVSLLTEQDDGYHHLIATWSQRHESDLRFDKENGLLHWLDPWTRVESYTRIDGFLIADEISISRKGGWTRIRALNVETNPDLPDNCFTP